MFVYINKLIINTFVYLYNEVNTHLMKINWLASVHKLHSIRSRTSVAVNNIFTPYVTIKSDSWPIFFLPSLQLTGFKISYDVVSAACTFSSVHVFISEEK